MPRRQTSELCRYRRPAIYSTVVDRLATELLTVFDVTPSQPIDVLLRAANRSMRVIEQHALDLPDVARRQSPVVVPERAQIHDRVASYAAGVVDVRIDIAQRQRAWCREDGLAAMQAGIARSRNGSPSAVQAIDEDHVVEVIDRLEAEDERRVSVLFEDDGGRERRLEAVRGPVANDSSEAAKRRAPGRRLSVVSERVEIALHGERRAQPLDEAPFDRRECRQRRGANGLQPRSSARSRARTAPIGCR